MRLCIRFCFAAFSISWLVPVPLCLGQEPSAGVVIQANRAQIGGASLSSGASVFSGDLLVTDEEGQVQIQAGRAKVVLQPNSSLRLFRSAGQTVVELERGIINYATSGTGEELVIFALDVRLVPLRTAPATGQVTIVSRCEVRATSQTSTLDVTSGKETKTVEETKTYSVRSDFGVEYHDSWKPVPADYPDFDPNSYYHRSHSHGPCGLADVPHQAPASAMSSTHFKIGAAIVGGGVTCLILCRDFESPDKPRAH
jgi:hypothetical protein